MKKNKTIAIILAGGEGKRMNGGEPKQFIELGGKPLIMYALESFAGHDLVSGVIVVSSKEHIVRMREMIKKSGIGKIIDIIPGGDTRQKSSFLGVKRCPEDAKIVLIHDAARPFVSRSIIEEVIKAAEDKGAAAPAIDVTDTIVFEDSGYISGVPERKKMKRMQTPQGFKYKVILKAHREGEEQGAEGITDDCGLIIRSGLAVRIIEGDTHNIKITDRKDLSEAGRYLGNDGERELT
ncbi:MAG: 2-C-methyl-D-erythritol 4-phosphate cytidylyltransferase [Candidatus Omnitrophota bacterium]|nr:2-C-methyl-D-erythritol 4-phosphate cytidylyltransferase [Candidatus Omnitrophota bacterium]